MEINVDDTDGKLLCYDTITGTTYFQIDVPNNIDIEVIGKSYKEKVSLYQRQYETRSIIEDLDNTYQFNKYI